MKTMIIYASKYGCTEDCANQLKLKLSPGTVVHNILKEGMPTCSGFDTVIIGGSVYVGNIQKEIKTFCRQNISELMDKKLGLFICCGTSEQSDEFISANYPEQLRQHAAVTASFGGEFRISRMGFLHKTIIKAITKGDYAQTKISSDAINSFAKAIV